MNKMICLVLLLPILAGVVYAEQYQENANYTSCKSILCDGDWNTSKGVSYPITENIRYIIPENVVGALWKIGIGGATNYYPVPDRCFVSELTGYPKQLLALRILPTGQYGSSYHYFGCEGIPDTFHYITHAYKLNWVREEGVLWQTKADRESTRWDFTPNTVMLAGFNSNDNYGNPSVVSNVQFTQVESAIGVAMFISTNGILTVTNKSWFDYTNGITIESKFYSQRNSHRYLVSKPDVFLLQVGAENRLQAGIFVNGAWTPLVTGPKISLNRWYDAVFTYDNRDAKLYVNGRLYAQKIGVNKPLAINTNQLFFGNKADLTRGFVGYIDRIEITNRALTSTEVAVRYSN